MGIYDLVMPYLPPRGLLTMKHEEFQNKCELLRARFRTVAGFGVQLRGGRDSFEEILRLIDEVENTGIKAIYPEIGEQK